MMVFKRKQIVVVALILMIIVAGYLQYSYKKSSSTADNKEDGKLGEAYYVDSQQASEEKGVPASKQANDFFAQARLERETARSRDVDALKEISSDENATNEVKAESYEKMMKLIDNSQMEMRIETLIKEKGFEDAIALLADDGSLDIIVKAPSLNSAQTAQLADIASRHANLSMDKIHIRNMY